MDYNATFLSSDAQQTVIISADLIEQINEQLGEEFVRPEDFVETAVRQQLAALQHTSKNAQSLQEV